MYYTLLIIYTEPFHAPQSGVERVVLEGPVGGPRLVGHDCVRVVDEGRVQAGLGHAVLEALLHHAIPLLSLAFSM